MTTHPMENKPGLLEVSVSAKMIEDVMIEMERDGIAFDATETSREEFTNRVMEKITNSARIIEGGTA